ncbi:MAG TPA: hypothetical protein VFC00_32515 [Micromonosporaceae bacterium]|nr:hypothetical protein [Micromonosporaceae bacterium]
MTSDGDIRAKAREVQDKAMEKLLDEFGIWAGEGEIMDAIVSFCEAIPPRFEWFTERDPTRLDSMLGDLNFVKNGLSEGVTAKIDLVKGDVQDWRGTAAEQFTENFLSPFGQIRLNQIGLVDELTVALEAERKILEESRRNIVQIGDGTLTALNALDDGGTDWGMVLTVVGAVVGVVGAAATGGTSLAITFALVGGGLSIASAAVAEASVHGDTVEDVITSMDEAIRKLKDAMADEEDILVRAMSQDVDTVYANWDNLQPKRPYVADVTASDLSEFQLPASMAS